MSPLDSALNTGVLHLQRMRVIPCSFTLSSLKNASSASNPVKSMSFTPEKSRHKHHGLGQLLRSKKRPICFLILDLKEAVFAKKDGSIPSDHQHITPSFSTS